MCTWTGEWVFLWRAREGIITFVKDKDVYNRKKKKKKTYYKYVNTIQSIGESHETSVGHISHANPKEKKSYI